MPRQARLDSPGTLHHVMVRKPKRVLLLTIALFSPRYDGYGSAGVAWYRYGGCMRHEPLF